MTLYTVQFNFIVHIEMTEIELAINNINVYFLFL